MRSVFNQQNKSFLLDLAKDTADLLSDAVVVLFGSRSRGDSSDTSDWDIMVIAEDFSGVRILDRWSICKPLWDTALPVEVTCLTFGEAHELMKRGNPGVFDALFEGEFLAGSKNLFDSLRGTLLAAIEQGTIARRKNGWELF